MKRKIFAGILTVLLLAVAVVVCLSLFSDRDADKGAADASDTSVENPVDSMTAVSLDTFISAASAKEFEIEDYGDEKLMTGCSDLVAASKGYAYAEFAQFDTAENANSCMLDDFDSLVKINDGAETEEYEGDNYSCRILTVAGKDGDKGGTTVYILLSVENTYVCSAAMAEDVSTLLELLQAIGYYF